MSLAERHALEQRFPSKAAANESEGLAAAAPQAGEQAIPQAASTPADTASDIEKNGVTPFKTSFFKKHEKAIFGGVATLLGGGTVAGVIGLTSFFGVLKLDSIITRLDNLFMAAPQKAGQEMLDHMLNTYMTKYVLKGVGQNLCESTAEINRSCVAPIDGDGPVKTLFRAWSQKRIEYKLATKYGLEFGRTPKGDVYMRYKGTLKNIPKSEFNAAVNGDVSLDELAVKIGAVGDRVAVTDLLEVAGRETTLWQRILFRFRFAKILEAKYGVKLCVFACELRKKIDGTVAEKQKAMLAAVDKYVLDPVKQAYKMLPCLVQPDGEACGQALQKTLSPDDTQLTAATAAEQETLDAAAESVGDIGGNLSKTVASAEEDTAEGVGKSLLVRVISSVFGEGVGEAAEKAIPIVGWVLFAAAIIHGGSTAGKVVKYMSYAMFAAAAVKLFMAYATIDSEMKSGNVDTVVLGSVVQSLGTNLTGAGTDQSDATSTPAYAALLGGGVDPKKSNYRCNDGNPVPSGQVVCPEEVLDRGNDFITNVSNFINAIPGLPQLATVINWGNDIIGDITGAVFNFACNTTPGCQQAVAWVGQNLAGLATWLVEKIISSPFTDNMSGGRTFDMLAAGADVSANKNCQIAMGCAKLTNQQIADIRSSVLSQQKTEFDQQPLIARIFSTSSPYSLISQVAMVMPANLTDVSMHLADMLGNPLGTIASIFSSMFSGSKAFAAPEPMNDPFGVIQYGYTSDQIPADPEAYWDQHCQNNPNFAVDWENSQQQDENTGEAVATTPEPCLLIQSMVQSAGGLFDQSLLPSGSMNPDPGSTPTGSGCGGSGTYAALVSQGANFAGVDQGIDFVPATSGGYTICAPAAGTIIQADQTGHHFERTTGQAEVIEKLDQAPSAPNSSQYIYYAELVQIDSNIHVGSHVAAGTPIGTNTQSPGIEVGWGLENGNFLCGPGIPTVCGTSFNTWVQALSNSGGL